MQADISGIIQWGQVLIMRQVGGGKKTRQSERNGGNGPPCHPERGHNDSSLSRQGGQRRIRRRDKVEIGNSPIRLSLFKRFEELR
jgi:hypothetical protein